LSLTRQNSTTYLPTMEPNYTYYVPTNTHALYLGYPQGGHPQNVHQQGGHYVVYQQGGHPQGGYPHDGYPQDVHPQNFHPQNVHYVAHQQGGHCDCHIQPNNSYNNFYRIQFSNGPNMKLYPTHPSQPSLNSSHPISPITEETSEPSELTTIVTNLKLIGLSPQCKDLNVITTPPLPELIEISTLVTPKPIEIPTLVTPKPIEIPTLVIAPKPIEIPTLVIAPKPQTLVSDYFAIQDESKTKSETRKDGENPVDYVFRLLEDLFKHRLGLEFYSLWGVFYKSVASDLSRQVSDRLNVIWELMRKKRNRINDLKSENVNCCWKFNCCQPCIEPPSGSPKKPPNPFLYKFCEAHKTLVTIFDKRHPYSNNTTVELMAVSRLIHLLLPEPDEVAKAKDHLTVTRRSCIMQLGGRLAVGEEGFPMDFHLMNLKIANPIFYGKIELFINQYKEDFPDAFPYSKESPLINVKKEEPRSIIKKKKKKKKSPPGNVPTKNRTNNNRHGSNLRKPKS